MHSSRQEIVKPIIKITVMKKFFLQLIAIVLYKTVNYETGTLKEMKAEYLQKKKAWEEKAAALQRELDREHMAKYGWDSKTLRQKAA